MADLLSINSINCNGLRDPQSKKHQIIAHSLQNQADIIFLLDTRLDIHTQTHISKHWNTNCHFAHNQTQHTNGIAILYDNSKTQLLATLDDNEGRYTISWFKVGTQTFLITAIYAPASPTKDREKFFKTISDQISENKEPEHTLILLGDFNMVEDPTLDRYPPRNKKDPSLLALKKLLRHHDFEDCWRNRNTTSQEFTYKSNHTHTGFSRIDRIYTTRRDRNIIKNTQILPFTLSDHYMVSVTLHTTLIKSHKTPWKLNIDLLNDHVYTEMISTFITQTNEPDHITHITHPNCSERWDALKLQLKLISIQYQKQKRKETNKIEKSIDKRLRNTLNKNNFSKHTLDYIKLLEQKKKAILTNKSNEKMKRYRLQFIQEGEQCSSFFLTLENKSKLNTTMHEIFVKETGVTTTEQCEILNETHKFYEELYTAVPTSNIQQQAMLGKLHRKLTHTQSQTCEGPITHSEIKEAIGDLQLGKTSGLDGLPAEFYKTFYDDLKNNIFDLIHTIKHEKHLTKSELEASITTLPKKGDLTKLENWRPLSILNVDYKIITKILANRISKTLPHIIHEDQTCNIEHRSIQHSLSIIRDMISYANTTQEKITLLSLDQMKAFDKLDWNFLNKIMEKFNYGPDILTWIKIIQTDITSAVKVNGQISKQFAVNQGVRQGCPLSPFLYVIYAEVLAEAIRQNKGIKGVQIEDKEFKVSQYADDTTLFLTGDESFAFLQESLDQFSLASGAQVNPEKCHGLWLGSNLWRRDEPLQYKWSSTEIKILGLYFGDQEAQDKNFQIVEEKFLKTLTQWKQRDLSLKGRKLVVNQLASSKLNYPAHILICPPKIVQTMSEAMLNFTSNYKAKKISKHILHLPVNLGGIYLVDLKRKFKALRLAWIPKILNNHENPKWKILFIHFLGKFRNLHQGINTFKMFLPQIKKFSEHKLPIFYKTLLNDWTSLTKKDLRPKPTTLQLIYHEPIFHNIHIQNSSHTLGPIIPPNWYKKCNHLNLRTLGDICKTNTKGLHNTEELKEMIQHKNIQPFVDKLTTCIPHQWLHHITHTDPPTETFNDIIVILADEAGKKLLTHISKQNSRSFYTLLSDKNFLEIQEDLSADRKHFYTNWTHTIGATKWEKTFHTMYKNHIDKKVTDVQYKLIHNNIMTRNQFFLAKLQNTAQCPRCKGTTLEEHPEHIFISCPKSKSMWKKLIYIATKLFTPKIDLNNPKWIVAGFTEANIPFKYKQTLEDIRSAYFHTAWKSRYETMWNMTDICENKHFVRTIGKYFTLRYEIAKNDQNLTNFNINFGIDKICKIRNGEITLS